MQVGTNYIENMLDRRNQVTKVIFCFWILWVVGCSSESSEIHYYDTHGRLVKFEKQYPHLKEKKEISFNYIKNDTAIDYKLYKNDLLIKEINYYSGMDELNKVALYQYDDYSRIASATYISTEVDQTLQITFCNEYSINQDTIYTTLYKSFDEDMTKTDSLIDIYNQYRKPVKSVTFDLTKGSIQSMTEWSYLNDTILIKKELTDYEASFKIIERRKYNQFGKLSRKDITKNGKNVRLEEYIYENQKLKYINRISETDSTYVSLKYD